MDATSLPGDVKADTPDGLYGDGRRGQQWDPRRLLGTGGCLAVGRPDAMRSRRHSGCGVDLLKDGLHPGG
jgi:hypothetical protein